MFNMRIERSTWRTTPRNIYHEVRLRDWRGKVVAYALHEDERKLEQMLSEFLSDYGEDV